MQLEFFDIPSPCVGVCQSDEKGLCQGCMRTRDERQNWQSFDVKEKQKVIKRCQTRHKRKLQKSQAEKQPVKAQSIEVVEPSEIQQPSLLDPPSKAIVDNSKDLDFGDFEL
jgi:hypothetical protein